jgi:hypothetical protein
MLDVSVPPVVGQMAFMRNLRRGHRELELPPELRVAAAFGELAGAL